jgi:hypothetical protein
LVLIILGSTVLGAVLTFLASLGPRIKRVRETRQLEQTVQPQGERIRQLKWFVIDSRETLPPAALS